MREVVEVKRGACASSYEINWTYERAHETATHSLILQHYGFRNEGRLGELPFASKQYCYTDAKREL